MPVYFIMDESYRVKIGKSLKPRKRRLGLRGGNAENLKIIRVVEGYTAVEKWLHKQYDALRIDSKREWFTFTDSMMEVEIPEDVIIADIPSEYPPYDIEEDMRKRPAVSKELWSHSTAVQEILLSLLERVSRAVSKGKYPVHEADIYLYLYDQSQIPGEHSVKLALGLFKRAKEYNVIVPADVDGDYYLPGKRPQRPNF